MIPISLRQLDWHIALTVYKLTAAPRPWAGLKKKKGCVLAAHGSYLYGKSWGSIFPYSWTLFTSEANTGIKNPTSCISLLCL